MEHSTAPKIAAKAWVSLSMYLYMYCAQSVPDNSHGVPKGITLVLGNLLPEKAIPEFTDDWSGFCVCKLAPPRQKNSTCSVKSHSKQKYWASIMFLKLSCDIPTICGYLGMKRDGEMPVMGGVNDKWTDQQRNGGRGGQWKTDQHRKRMGGGGGATEKWG